MIRLGALVCFLSLCSSSLSRQLVTLLNQELLYNYKRPITILYITENPDYAIFEYFFNNAQHDVVALWSNTFNDADFFIKNNYKNVIVFGAPITKFNLLKISQCEHFDVVFVDAIDAYPLSYLEKLCDLGDYLVITTSRHAPKIENYINSTFEYQIIESENTTFIIETTKHLLKTSFWNCQSGHGNYKIESNFKEKFLLKKSGDVLKKCSWKPGVNLYTFCKLKGIYPAKDYIKTAVLEIFNAATHKDFGAANIILQGKKLKLIDYDDTCYIDDPYERLQKTLDMQLSLLDS